MESKTQKRTRTWNIKIYFRKDTLAMYYKLISYLYKKKPRFNH